MAEIGDCVCVGEVTGVAAINYEQMFLKSCQLTLNEKTLKEQQKKPLLILTLNIMHVDAPACTNTCMYTHVGPLKPMFDMKQNQETLT